MRVPVSPRSAFIAGTLEMVERMLTISRVVDALDRELLVRGLLDAPLSRVPRGNRRMDEPLGDGSSEPPPPPSSSAAGAERASQVGNLDTPCPSSLSKKRKES